MSRSKMAGVNVRNTSISASVMTVSIADLKFFGVYGLTKRMRGARLGFDSSTEKRDGSLKIRSFCNCAV